MDWGPEGEVTHGAAIPAQGHGAIAGLAALVD